jgi:teichuronic acid biosynthesis glycosyltransferase TuaC
MRILTFTSLFPNARAPAFGIFIYQRVSHFADRPGASVQVIAPVPYFPAWLPVSKWRLHSQVPKHEIIGNLNVYHPRYPLLPKVAMPLHGLLMFLGTYPRARTLHRQFRFDCIDAHYVYPDGLAAVLLGRMLHLPVILSARGTDINSFPVFKMIRPQIRWALKQATGVIGVSTPLKHAMVELGAHADCARTIGNGIDLTRFQPFDRSQARRYLGLPLDAQIVVSVGTLVPAKGHSLLIRAIARLAAERPNLHAYIVGEGPCRNDLERDAKTLGVENRIHLVGVHPNEELKYWYSAADVSCLASSREGWANVLLESIACGTPVVATRVGGAPEVITSAGLGLLVQPNAEAITAGLDAALKKSWDRNNLVYYAASRTWDVVAKEMEEFLVESVEKRRQRISLTDGRIRSAS